MVSGKYFLVLLATIFTILTDTTAFWFGTEEQKPSSARLLYPPTDYYRQYMQPPMPYSIPLPVPLPAQLAPAAVQNVQLVPCLCPVSQEYPFDNEFATRKSQFVQQQPSNQQRRK